MSSEKQETTAPASPDVALQLETFFEVNKKKMFVAIIVATVVGVGYYVTEASRQERQKEASTALALVEINKIVPGSEKPVVVSAEEFFKISSDFNGTSAAEMAFLRGSFSLFEAGKYSEAQQKFDEFLKNYPDSILKSTAELGIAASLEGQKSWDKAAEAYQKVVTAYPAQAPAMQAKLALGWLQENKGQFAAALKLYEEVSSARDGGNSPSAWSQEAISRKSRLIERHPELAPATLPSTVAAPAAAKPSIPVPVKK